MSGPEEPNRKEPKHHTGDAGQHLDDRLQPVAGPRASVFTEIDRCCRARAESRQSSPRWRHDQGAENDRGDIEAAISWIPAGPGATVDQGAEIPTRVDQISEKRPRLTEESPDDQRTDDNGNSALANSNYRERCASRRNAAGVARRSSIATRRPSAVRSQCVIRFLCERNRPTGKGAPVGRRQHQLEWISRRPTRSPESWQSRRRRERHSPLRQPCASHPRRDTDRHSS